MDTDITFIYLTKIGHTDQKYPEQKLQIFVKIPVLLLSLTKEIKGTVSFSVLLNELTHIITARPCLLSGICENIFNVTLLHKKHEILIEKLVWLAAKRFSLIVSFHLLISAVAGEFKKCIEAQESFIKFSNASKGIKVWKNIGVLLIPNEVIPEYYKTGML